jgi:RNA polymerase sigma factor (sigma-70 family)
MNADDPKPADVTALLARVRAGDAGARDELVRACQGRLEHLARRMLRRHPPVRRWADTGDVFQNATVRLLRALESTPAADTRALLNLAAAVTRRELLDLARHFHGPHGVGANHASRAPGDGVPADRDPPDPAGDGADLDRWAALHAAAERLPADEREAFGLSFYHGWAQDQIADLFGVDVRTVRRRLRRAAAALHSALGGVLPGD